MLLYSNSAKGTCFLLWVFSQGGLQQVSISATNDDYSLSLLGVTYVYFSKWSSVKNYWSEKGKKNKLWSWYEHAKTDPYFCIFCFLPEFIKKKVFSNTSCLKSIYQHPCHVTWQKVAAMLKRNVSVVSNIIL